MRVKINKRLEEIGQIVVPPPPHVTSTSRPPRTPGKPDPAAGFVPHFPDPVRLRPPSDLPNTIPGLGPDDPAPDLPELPLR